MQLRRQVSTPVNQVVVKMRDSMMEPALRLKHSLQEPGMAFHSPTTAAAASTGAGTASASMHEPGGFHLKSTTATSTVATTVKHPMAVQATLGPIGTARRIYQREGWQSFYKGLTAVYAGSILKFSIRFVSFEQYREWLTLSNNNERTMAVTFTAGLASGLTEAIMVVTPAEVCKIRMQSQYHSLMDPAQMKHRKYTNVFQTAMTIVREEGPAALYKGLVPTMLRQGLNQAVNFTAYNKIKTKVMDWQQTEQLQAWQSLLIGGLSGGMGPLCNNPLDVVKTRLQKQVITAGKTPKYSGLIQACLLIAKEEGVLALWKGITPRLLRIMPGQAITFMTYEAASRQLSSTGFFDR
jgi:solute carrier family 25 citrate transporter 1